MKNGGIAGALVVNKVREGHGAYGYNAATRANEALIAAGVIDPTKVVRVALQNATSVAALMLTTEVLIAAYPEESQRRTPPAAGHGAPLSANGAQDLQ